MCSLFSSGRLRVIDAALARSDGLLDAIFLDRSRIWPILDFTMYSDPKYLLIVFALAGDSTITSDFAIELYCSIKFVAKKSCVE